MIDSVIKAKKKYHLHTLLEEWKYEQERIKKRISLMMIWRKVNLVNLIVKQNLILIMENLTNNLFNIIYFNNNESLRLFRLIFLSSVC